MSRLFHGYRAVGVVTDDVPAATQRLGTVTFVTVSTGRAFQVYRADTLALSMVSSQLHASIRSVLV